MATVIRMASAIQKPASVPQADDEAVVSLNRSEHAYLAVDGLTGTVSFCTGYAGVLGLLSLPILPEHYMSTIPVAEAATLSYPVGAGIENAPVNGPFQYASASSSSIELTRNENFKAGLRGAPAYLDRHGVPATREALREHQLVGYVDDLLYSPSLNFRDEVLKGWLPSIAVATAMGQMMAVAAGAGIGVLHNFMVRSRMDLVRILPEISISRAYWLVLHEDMRATKRISAVADFIVEVTRAAHF